MFGRKKRKDAWISEMDDTRVTVYDFRRRLTKYESYRPAAYRLSPALQDSEMFPKLDEHLARLFSGEIDSGNSDVLDEMIFSAAREGKCELAIQRYNHKDMIVRLAARYHSDYEDLKNLRSQRQEELDAVLQEHEVTCFMEEKAMRKESRHEKHK